MYIGYLCKQVVSQVHVSSNTVKLPQSDPRDYMHMTLFGVRDGVFWAQVSESSPSLKGKGCGFGHECQETPYHTI